MNLRDAGMPALDVMRAVTALASSWSDTEQRRSEIRKAVEDVLKSLSRMIVQSGDLSESIGVPPG
jgi:hypothetical protein